MNYEVKYGETTEIVNAGNPYQACILCLQASNIEKHYVSFEVTQLGGFCHQTYNIPLSEVVSILLVSEKNSEEISGLAIDLCKK